MKYSKIVVPSSWIAIADNAVCTSTSVGSAVSKPGSVPTEESIKKHETVKFEDFYLCRRWWRKWRKTSNHHTNRKKERIADGGCSVLFWNRHLSILHHPPSVLASVNYSSKKTKERERVYVPPIVTTGAPTFVACAATDVAAAKASCWASVK